MDDRVRRHAEILLDVSRDSGLGVDRDVLQRNGVFRFEDGFEAA